MKSLLQGFNSRYQQAEKRISELGDRTIEITESEGAQRKMIQEDLGICRIPSKEL